MRRVFFSFHYKDDVFRANQVRNSWVTQTRTAAGFVDAAEFERVRSRGEAAIKRWIREQLRGTSVTAVLIGLRTASRPYVKYEIQESYKRGNGLVGVRIHQLRGPRLTTPPGNDPLDNLGTTETGTWRPLSSQFKTYDYVSGNGYRNLGSWVEEAARIAGR